MAIPLRETTPGYQASRQSRPRVIPLATVTRPVGHRDRYRLRSLVAVSRTGQVWKGFDTLLRRPVAIKMLRRGPSRSPDHRSRFRREIQTMGRVSHPHVLPILDGESDGPRPFLATPFMERTIADLVADGPIRPSAVARMGRQLAEGLAHIHELGIIHCDVKPANLFLERGRLRIGDFGIARDTGCGSESRVVGSIHYMAPDRVKEHTATQADDLYSLGVVLYEMVVGRPPYLGDRPIDVARQHLAGLPNLQPVLGGAGLLGGVIRSLLNVSRSGRPTARRLAHELANLDQPAIDVAG